MKGSLHFEEKITIFQANAQVEFCCSNRPHVPFCILRKPSKKESSEFPDVVFWLNKSILRRL